MTLVTERWCAGPAAAGAIRDARQLSATIDRVDTLSDRAVGAMFNLYDQYYDATSRPLFEADLRAKDYVVTLREPSGALAGFSTLAGWRRRSAARGCARSIPATPSSTMPIGARRRWRSPGSASPARSRRARLTCRSTGS